MDLVDNNKNGTFFVCLGFILNYLYQKKFIINKKKL